ncbi:NIL domain-containing protein [Lacisediminihabitans sp.]|uniref:NIL domain-containing protein n=1 Tax=Lacisediminihabitans sp. TaxID=2787631 RepID=UPI00374CE102
MLSDEATSGLDPESTASIVALLKELRDDLDLSILFITHEMDTVLQVADSVARLDHGHIVESGALVDLLRDADSDLGRALRPRRDWEAASGADVIWFVSYEGGHVPPDWVSRLGAELGVPISILGASIERINGATVGHATLGIGGVDPARVTGTLAALGLTATLDDTALQPERDELEDVA